MRTVQHPSKLQLLGNQYSPGPSPWPRVILAAVLLVVIIWNVKTIMGRYAEPAAEPAAVAFAHPFVDPGALDAEERVFTTISAPPVTISAPGGARPQEPEAPAVPVGERSPPAAAGASLGGTAQAPLPAAGETEPAAPAVPPPTAEAPIFIPGSSPGNGHALANRVIAGSIRSGQAVATAMMDAGLSGEQTHQVVSALTGVFDFRRARPDEGFRIKLGPEGELELFDYERSPHESYVVHRKNGSLVGFRRDLQVERELVRIEGEILSSLFGAVEAAGADAALAQLLANVLAWDVDFYRDPRRGDRFAVVVERFHHRGRHLRYGDVLAAEYKGEVGHIRLFRYERSDGRVGFYDEKGQSAQRAFLRAPLQVVRITSGFGNRRHPILGYSRQHQGVDYGAPTGTPVWAVGDGTVLTAGRQGAYGNLIVVRHVNSYTTYYAHLSRIDVRVGERVRQQQVIGRVGSTGMSTGPHLHYEIRHQGRHINPLTLQLPPREPLPASALPDFDASIERARALLDGVQLLALAPGAIPPP